MNKNKQFKTGDVVYLNSGSPPLTIVCIDVADEEGDGGDVAVAWIDAKGENREATMPVACFTKDRQYQYEQAAQAAS